MSVAISNVAKLDWFKSRGKWMELLHFIDYCNSPLYLCRSRSFAFEVTVFRSLTENAALTLTEKDR